MSAGNPVLSVPNGDELEAATKHLDLMVARDFHRTETAARCDYILPVTTMYERDDFALTFQQFQATPFRQATEAVVRPPGQARTEWEIIDDLMWRMRRHTPLFAVLGLARSVAHRLGRRFHPRPLADLIIRLSAGGRAGADLRPAHRRTPALANRVGGVNVNLLMSSEPGDIEALAGMSRLTGIPISVHPARETLPPTRQARPCAE